MRAPRVVSLWRFPFKSMLGEQQEALTLTERGVDFDRAFAFRELATRKKLTARAYPALLNYQARVRDGKVEVQHPDGSRHLADDAALLQQVASEYGRKVELAAAFDERNPDGLFDDRPILLASMQSLASLSQAYPQGNFDMRRFRANIWIDFEDSAAFPEERWLHGDVRIGSEVVLHVDKLCERCVMTTMPQQELEQDFGILKTITMSNNAVLGIYCSVVTGGRIQVGDQLQRC